MEPASWLDLGVAALCLLLVALASATEAALAHVSRHKLRQLAEGGRRGARSVDWLLDSHRVTDAAMTVLYLFAATAFTVLLADLFLRQGVPGGLGAALALAVPVLLLLGHGLPRALARSNPETAATALAGFAWVVAQLARPLIRLTDALTGLIVRVLHRSRAAPPDKPAEEELTVLISGENGEGFEGVIEEDEREMIDAILQLEERTARDIMVPRLDIVAVPDGAQLPEVVETIERAGHSRLPVYHGSIDAIVGIVYAKDLLHFLPRAEAAPPLAQLARPAYIVPEAKPLDDLLHELQTRKVHMAIVVDEYGGTAGVVTIEDILEEIVGEIDDEYDVTTVPLVEAVSDRELLVDGRIGAEEVDDLLDLAWTEEEEHITLSGLVQRELGRLPAEGESLDYVGTRITVLAVEGNRLKRLRVEKLAGAGIAVGGDASAATGAEPAK
ncbi:MAG: hemolysin family protein [Chloroflexota bacterium]|nr:hemolysin family protein [Chloroflexota bacterium]